MSPSTGPKLKRPKSKLGKARTGQLLSTFGPGSIVDLPDRGSYMVLGLAGWREGERIDEPNLEAILRMDRLCVPGSTKDGPDIPVASFPAWHHCGKCGRLITEDFCRRRGCDQPAPPARFIVACRNGHIDDFPWAWWAHKGADAGCPGTALELDDRSGSNSLGDLWVRCREHNTSRSLMGALSPDAFKSYPCARRRPWLSDVDPAECDKSVAGMLRGASNVWFPDSISALSLPRHSSPIHVFLKEHFQTLNALDSVTRGLVLRQLLAPTRFSVEEGLRAIEQHKSVIADAKDLRREEYEALTAEAAVPDLRPPAPHFAAREGVVVPELASLLERIVLVERLREVSVLRGFTRLEGPDPEEPGRVRGAPISAAKPQWLPSREVFGEGIFLVLAEGALERWENEPDVRARAGRIETAYSGWREARSLPPAPRSVTPRRILIHTLAHLLIRELSLACGYGISSLRERIFADTEQRGLLVYTASADSDGSLGGLVAMGDPRHLVPVMRAVAEQAHWCSQDPLCGERSPDRGGYLSAAACHACLLLPETSCELGNRFLDRASVSSLLA